MAGRSRRVRAKSGDIRAAASPIRAARRELGSEGLLPGREAKLRAYIRQAEAETRRGELIDKWRPWAGTPETHEKHNALPMRRRASSLHRLERLGKITSDERAGGEEIAMIVEQLQRAASVSAQSLEERVDCSGSGRDHLVESLRRVRLEVAYRTWRLALPQPKRMLIDMVLTDGSWLVIAARHRVGWRRARASLIQCLRLWQSIKEVVWKTLDERDLNDAHKRLGQGTIEMLRPKAPRQAEAELTNGA
jgi:hypothetical protein